MKNPLVIVAVSFGVLASTPSHAADYGLPADPLGAHDWSGSYFGVKLGGVVDGRTDGGFAGAADAIGLDGVLVGIMSGRNFQFDHIVLGLDSDFSFTDVNGSTTIGGQAGEVSLDTLSTTRGRIGYAYDRFLPYVTGGFATARADFSLDGAGSENDEWFFGYTVGGGVEWAVTDTIAARVEYQFIDFGSESISIGGNRSTASIDDLHVVRAGVSIKTGFIFDAIKARVWRN
ncbi:MAG: outer membrane protein [Pseudomonadota bacterium]